MSCGKINYASYKAAKKAANCINKRPFNKKTATVYQCDICNCYHITSRHMDKHETTKRKEKTNLAVVKFKL